jgi:hypothetical protein
MFDDAMRSLDGMCGFPSSTRREQIKGLRAKANEMFEIAMAKMNERHSDASPVTGVVPGPSREFDPARQLARA